MDTTKMYIGFLFFAAGIVLFITEPIEDVPASKYMMWFLIIKIGGVICFVIAHYLFKRKLKKTE